MACLLLLGVVVYLLHSMQQHEDSDPAMIVLLVEELVAQQPKLLAPPAKAALPNRSSQQCLAKTRFHVGTKAAAATESALRNVLNLIFFKRVAPLCG